jgi:GNAT superfamily N-acetyltransferase
VERHAVYCAVEHGRVVGFYALTGAPPTLELEHCWVRPERIGHGIGTRLLEHAAATCRSAGATALGITADPYATAFYARMGATPAGTVASTPRGRTLPRLLLRV